MRKEEINISDGSIKIKIEVDGKEVNIASKELDKLEESGIRSGKGIKAAEGSMDSLADSSSKAGSSVKGTGDAIDGLGDSSTNASKGIKGAEGAVDGLADSSGKAQADVKGMSDSVESAADNSQKATGKIQKFATAIGLVAIASAAFKVLRASMDDAISRFDTLNQFPKVLQALGVSAEESERAMERLSEGIDGLPTTLNDIAGSAQRMYTSFGNMDEATDTAIALNNALLGSGSSAEQAKRGTEQYIKALQTGTFDLNTWNTLSETMDVGLVKIAESFGFAGKSAKDDLYKALQNGTITLDDFNAKLIEVGTGTGIMAKLAKENSIGIATSLGNLRNAAARGIANILDSFNKLSREVTGKEIAHNIDGLKDIVSKSFEIISKSIERSAPFVRAFGSAVSALIPIVQTLSPALIGLGTAYAIHKIISLTTTAIKANTAAATVSAVAKNTYAIATNQLALAMTLAMVKIKLKTAAILAYNKVIFIATTVQAALATGMSLATIATIALSGAIHVLNVAIKVLLGPIGWVTLAIGALVGAAIGIVNWFRRSTEEGKKLSAETDSLAGSTEGLIDSVNSSSEAYNQNQKDIKASAEANRDLIGRIEELSEKENKSAEDKLLLNGYINRLNESVDDLNLSYNAESDALSESSEKLRERIDLIEEETSFNDALARQGEITQNIIEIEMQKEETNALMAEANVLKEEGSITNREYKKTIEELETQEESLIETEERLKEENKALTEQIEAGAKAQAEAIRNSTEAQMISFDELSESQQATVESMKSTWEDYKNAATDMFDTLSDEAELTVAEMTANLEENQRIIGEWSNNIAELAERGVDEGLLETLRQAGPESAGHVNALVNASDEELQQLSIAFAEGGNVATDALSKSLGIEESGVMDAVGHLVTDTGQALSQQIESAGFDEIGGAIPEGLAGGIESGSADAENASKNMADNTTDAAKAAFGINSPSRVFREIGTGITDGLALGVSDGTSKVTQAIQKMFNSVQTDSVRSFQNITKSYDNAVSQIERSLSKLPEVTQRTMQNMLSRLRNGAQAQITVMRVLSIDYDRSIRQVETNLNKLPVIAQRSMSNTLSRLRSGATSQVAVMRALSSNLLTPFNGTPAQFNRIGLNAMLGLNSGLNAGRARVMSTARGIANSVASTMKNALRIHSPSRLMRDDVGKWIPEGVALGIRENAKSVYKELDNLSNNMILQSTPEQALGASRMVYSSGGIRNRAASHTSGSKGIDMNSLANSIASKLKIASTGVFLDNREIGRMQWKVVSEFQERNLGNRDKFRR